MTIEEAQPGMPVRYQDFSGLYEYGRISSKNDHYIFVKFDKTVAKLGWQGTTSQACLPSTLKRL